MLFRKWKILRLRLLPVFGAIGLGALIFFYFPVAGQIPPSGLLSGPAAEENGTVFTPHWGRGPFHDSPDVIYTGSHLLMEMLSSLPPRLNFRPAGFKSETGSVSEGGLHTGNGNGRGIGPHDSGADSAPPQTVSGSYGSFNSGQIAGMMAGGSNAAGGASGGDQSLSTPGAEGIKPGSEPGGPEWDGPGPIGPVAGEPEPTGPGEDQPDPQGGEPVPEPAVWIMTLSGIIMLLRNRLRK